MSNLNDLQVIWQKQNYYTFEKNIFYMIFKNIKIISIINLISKKIKRKLHKVYDLAE